MKSLKQRLISILLVLLLLATFIMGITLSLLSILDDKVAQAESLPTLTKTSFINGADPFIKFEVESNTKQNEKYLNNNKNNYIEVKDNLLRSIDCSFVHKKGNIYYITAPQEGYLPGLSYTIVLKKEFKFIDEKFKDNFNLLKNL